MRRSLALSLLLLLGLGAWLGVCAWQAQQDLVLARGLIDRARDAVVQQDVTEAREAIRTAGDHTARARARTSGRLWRATARVPVLGEPLDAVGELAGIADDLTRRVLPPAADAAVAVAPGRVRQQDGSFDVTRIVEAGPPVTRAATGAARAERRATAVPTTGVPLIDDARDELRDQVRRLAADLRDAERVLTIAPVLLGQDRPRRYFVLVQQTSESRGTGGLPGGFVLLTADKGAVRLEGQGSNARLRSFTIAPPTGVPEDYVSRYRPLGAFSRSENVNLSPDLPVVSRVLAARWRAQGGTPYDALVALDAQALAAILRGSGPVVLADGRRLPPEQLPDYLAIGQYRDFTASASAGADRSQARQDALESVARTAASRLSGGGGDTEQLVRGLVTAVRSGHLRMASDDPSLAPVLRDSGVDGALPAGPAPLAYPVVFNSSGGKLDHFLDRSLRYESGGCADGRRRTRVTLRLVNGAPADGLPPYVTLALRNGKATQSTVNRLTAQVFSTRGAVLRHATLDGQALPAGRLLRATEAGLSVWQTQLDLPRGQARTLVLELDEPAVEGVPRVPEQPLARPLRQTVRWSACGG